MPEESGIGEGDDGLRQVTQHDRVRDAPNLAVRNGGLNHVTKLGIYSARQNHFFSFSSICLYLFPKNRIFASAKTKRTSR
jgi:hypothetical protein